MGASTIGRADFGDRMAPDGRREGDTGGGGNAAGGVRGEGRGGDDGRGGGITSLRVLRGDAGNGGVGGEGIIVTGGVVSIDEMGLAVALDGARDMGDTGATGSGAARTFENGCCCSGE